MLSVTEICARIYRRKFCSGNIYCLYWHIIIVHTKLYFKERFRVFAYGFQYRSTHSFAIST